MRSLIFLLTVLAVLILSGCSTPPTVGDELYSTPSVDEQLEDVEVEAEAYLFDARLKRDGKPTSVRLHFYDRGDIIGIGGRGYLGKGALKGVLSPDTILVYFPASDEFVYEPIDQLLNSSDCGDNTTDLNLFDYFRNLPDSIDQETNLRIEQISLEDKEREYAISQAGCDWQINLTYDYNNDVGWLIDEFSFDNGHNTTFKGSRRKFKANAKVSLNRFQVTIPNTAVRITP